MQYEVLSKFDLKLTPTDYTAFKAYTYATLHLFVKTKILKIIVRNSRNSKTIIFTFWVVIYTANFKLIINTTKQTTTD
jgi:hypothetical protein